MTIRNTGPGAPGARRRWGNASALLDDDEARRRLLDALSRCIVRAGTSQIRMAEIAEEAGVARSTLYRYFPTRDDVLVALLTERTDAALTRIVAGLVDPSDAATSLPELVLRPLALVPGSAINEALYSVASDGSPGPLQLNAEPILATVFAHYGPLLEGWQSSGQVHADLDAHDTVRWLAAVSIYLLDPPWRDRPEADRRAFVERYVSRALLR